MSLKCGIVGLPNVGKSTLFNAITKTSNAESANYPFCTIEPNAAMVPLADARLSEVAKIARSENIIYSLLEVVDIAGLVRGASKGEGLGNKFLSHVQEVDAIIHLVRTFENGDITHVENEIDAIRDIEIIEAELMLADLDSVENKLVKNQSKVKQKNEEAIEQNKVLETIKSALEKGKMANALIREGVFDEQELKILKQLFMITAKPVLYVSNVNESEVLTGNNWSNKVAEFAKSRSADHVLISAKLEREISSLPPEEAKDFMSVYGIEESGLSKVVLRCFTILNLITYFTSGPKESRSWTIKKGSLAPQAAGVIHSDFEKGFIRAEVISYEDYISFNGEAAAKEAGRMRSEGKEYEVQDADIILFRFNT